MSCTSSQVSTINTPDISSGFIDFLANGEFDEMLSSTPRRIFYSILLSQEEKISVGENDQRTSENKNVAWGGEDVEAIDAICSEALDKFIWGEDYTADDDRALDEICCKIESST